MNTELVCTLRSTFDLSYSTALIMSVESKLCIIERSSIKLKEISRCDWDVD